MNCSICNRTLAGNPSLEQCFNQQCNNFLLSCPNCGSGCITKDNREAECFCGFYFYYGPPARGGMEFTLPTYNPLQVQQNHTPLSSPIHQLQNSRPSLLTPQDMKSKNFNDQPNYFKQQSATPSRLEEKEKSSDIESLENGSYPQIAFVDNEQRVTMSLGFLFDELEFSNNPTTMLETRHYRTYINFEPRDPNEQTGTASQYKILPTTYNKHLVGSHGVRRAFGGGKDRFNISPISDYTNSAAGKIGEFEKNVRKLMKEIHQNTLTGTVNITQAKDVFLQVTLTEYNENIMMDYLFSKDDYQFIKNFANKNIQGDFINFIDNLAKYLPSKQNRYLWHFKKNHPNNPWEPSKLVLECELSPEDIVQKAGSLEIPRYSRKNNVPHDEKSCARLLEIWKNKKRHNGTYYFFESEINGKYFIHNKQLFNDISDYLSSDLRQQVNVPSQSVNDIDSYTAYMLRVKDLTTAYYAKYCSIPRKEDWIKTNNILEARTRSGINKDHSIENDEELDL